MNNKITLSVVIPLYNEAKNIPSLLKDYDEMITRDDIEIILVNNGSTDNTAHVLAELAPTYRDFWRLVSISINQGYGHGILTGLSEARGEFVGWTHGDLQTPAKDVLRALEIIECTTNNKTLYLKGLRRGRGLFDSIFTFGMSIFETVYLKTPLFDINAQPNIFHRDFFATWENPPHDFSLDLYTYYHARRAGLTVKRFPVLFPARVQGESSWDTGLLSRYKFIKRTVAFSKKLKREINVSRK